eukprot:m.223402 g.223402  ORF g.223402 m.223402 type:complete len:335 (+) comp10922_c0_seq1:313-1317(+)
MADANRVDGEESEIPLMDNSTRKTIEGATVSETMVDASDDVTATVPNPSEDDHGTDKLLISEDRAALARKAYKAGDIAASQAVHVAMSVVAPENHQEEGNYIKGIVFGGLDGIICAFASVASVNGADYTTGVIFVLGFSTLIANAISMAVGELLSEKAEKEWIRNERSREEWEFDNAPEAEISEMVDLYKEKGFSEDEARRVLQIMSRYKDFFVDHMLVHELGIMPPEEGEGSSMEDMKMAAVMFCSFVLFGFVPLLIFVIMSPFSYSGFDPRFLVCCIVTGLTLFGLGVLKSRFSQQSWWWSGGQVLVNGTAAAGVGYAISYGLAAAIPNTCS